MKTMIKQALSIDETVNISLSRGFLQGELKVPPGASGLVLFAHGSGSSRHSPRNQFVARVIRESGNGTLLFDLLTPAEERVDNVSGQLRFDISLLARRLVVATNWIKNRADVQDLKIGFFGSSTGGGAALVAAAELGNEISAVVSRGGRPDLAGAALSHVQSPTLLMVGEHDDVVIRLNEEAFAELQCEKDFKIIPHATHLFEEPGTLEAVAQLAAEWFHEHMPASR